MENENGTRRVNKSARDRVRAGIAGTGSNNTPDGNTSGGNAGDSRSGNSRENSGDSVGGTGSPIDAGSFGNGIADRNDNGTDRIESVPPSGITDGTGTGRRRIQFDTSETGSRTPRTVRIEGNAEAEESIGSRSIGATGTRGRGRSKKQNVTDDTANMLLQMIFFCLALTMGEHWQKTEDELNPAASALARMLSKLPLAASKAIDTYIDPLIFVMAIAALCSEPLKVEALKKANKTNAVNVPINQTKTAAETGFQYPPEYFGNNFPGVG